MQSCPVFLVVECEDSSYLPSLNGCKPLQQYYSDGQMEAMESEQTKQEEDQEIIDDKGQDMPETSAQGFVKLSLLYSKNICSHFYIA